MDVGILGLKKVCQWDHGTAPTLLLQNLSPLGNPFCWKTKPQMQEAMQIRVMVTVKY